jgi:hypothetical protein
MATPSALYFTIADITFCVTSSDRTLKLKPDQAILPFCGHVDSPDVQVAAGWRDLSNGAIAGRTIFDPGPSWKLYEQ